MLILLIIADKTGFGKMGRHVSVILQQNESYMIEAAKVKNLRFEITYSWQGARVHLDAGWILTSNGVAYMSKLFNYSPSYNYRYYTYEEALAFHAEGTQTFDHQHRGESSFNVFLNNIPNAVDGIFFTMWYVTVGLISF